MMLEPTRFDSLGELIACALSTFKTNICMREYARAELAQELKYVDVYRRVRSVVGALEHAGIMPGDHVAVLMSNQPAWLVAASAILIRGAVIVPIDYKLSADDQLALLAHSEAKLLFIEDSLARRLDGVSKDKTYPRAVVVGAETSARKLDVSWSEWLEHPCDSEVLSATPRKPEDIACVVYSSGTSGEPKGCLMPHRAYLSQLRALMQLFPLQETSRVFSLLPTNHAIDFMVGFLGPFASGARVVHQRTLRPEFIALTMKAEQITHIALVPLLLRALATGIEKQIAERPSWQQSALTSLTRINQSLTRKEPAPQLSRLLLSPVHKALGGSLEVIFAGGAFVDPNDAKRFYDWGFPVAIGYGLTECCTVATLNDLRPFRADSVGTAVPGVQLRIVTDTRANAAPGEVGEVWICGATLMQGYFHAPELSAAALVKHQGELWLRTGDLGSIDASGHLVLCGRAKNMIVTAGGKNVYPEDVEGALGHHDAWHELAVFSSAYLALSPKEKAESLVDEHLVAVIRSQHREESLRTLRERNRRLAEHKRIRSLLFVSETFPRTASMKIKREALRTQLQTHPEQLLGFAKLESDVESSQPRHA